MPEFDVYLFNCGIGRQSYIHKTVKQYLENGWDIKGMSYNYPEILILFTREIPDADTEERR